MAVEGQVKFAGEQALWEAAGVESGTQLQEVDQLSGYEPIFIRNLVYQSKAD